MDRLPISRIINYRQILPFITLVLLQALPAHESLAQDQNQPPAPAAVTEQAAAAPEAAAPAPEISAAEQQVLQVRQQLQEIQASLKAKRSELRAARRQLKQVTDESERVELEQRIAQEEDEIDNLRESFENIALGGLDLSVFEAESQTERFDWQQELQVVLKPVFQQLRQLTEKPRQIERLNGQISLLTDQIRISQRALENISQLIDEALEKDTLTRLEQVEDRWERRLGDLQRQREISQLQLQTLQNSSESILQQIRTAVRDFVTGRGLNLALAVAAYVLVYFLMKGLYAGYLFLARRGLVRMASSTTNRRIMAYSYQALTITLATLVTLAALYIRGDVLLLVIAIIILLIILLGLRNYLPRYLQESKLLLNIGAVRERERVIYKSLPWLVRSLGMYSRLYNPALDGLLRLPLSEMLLLVSRPYREDEPWFPTSPGDWVMMADGVIGQVLRQTPEIVQLKTKGTVLTYATSNFLAGGPRNLSEGFGVSTVFGIDYKHQAISTHLVPNILHEAIEQGLGKTDFGKFVENILVEFKEAAASSLNYQVYVTMKGEGAEFYFAVSRMVQRICVDTCNAQGWGIPFNQLTLNAGSGFSATPLI
jgi:small-conductance mechanosensitive channel